MTERCDDCDTDMTLVDDHHTDISGGETWRCPDCGSERVLTFDGGSEHVRGPVHPNVQSYARFETKRGDGSGAGYERWRSTERREHTPGDRREDVYVAHHRLLYLIHDDMIDEPIDAVLDAMQGADVHHANGVKWDNRLSRFEEDGEPNLQLVEHGTHSEITQAEMRAYGEDAKRQAAETERTDAYSASTTPGACGSCGSETDTFAVADALDAPLCIECSLQHPTVESFDVLTASEVDFDTDPDGVIA